MEKGKSIKFITTIISIMLILSSTVVFANEIESIENSDPPKVESMDEKTVSDNLKSIQPDVIVEEKGKIEDSNESKKTLNKEEKGKLEETLFTEESEQKRKVRVSDGYAGKTIEIQYKGSSVDKPNQIVTVSSKNDLLPKTMQDEKDVYLFGFKINKYYFLGFSKVSQTEFDKSCNAGNPPKLYLSKNGGDAVKTNTVGEVFPEGIPDNAKLYPIYASRSSMNKIDGKINVCKDMSASDIVKNGKTLTQNVENGNKEVLADIDESMIATDNYVVNINSNFLLDERIAVLLQKSNSGTVLTNINEPYSSKKELKATRSDIHIIFDDNIGMTDEIKDLSFTSYIFEPYSIIGVKDNGEYEELKNLQSSVNRVLPETIFSVPNPKGYKHLVLRTVLRRPKLIIDSGILEMPMILKSKNNDNFFIKADRAKELAKTGKKAIVDGYMIVHESVSGVPSFMNNQWEQNIKGESVKIGFNQYWNVTYKDGCAETAFADQMTKVKQGLVTPTFKGIPVRSGYDFIGWTPEVAPIVTKDVVYIAQWKKNESTKYNYHNELIVSFDKQGHGDGVASQTVAYGDKAIESTALSEDGWTFGGWYTDKNCTVKYDFNSPVYKDMVLYAKWTEKILNVTYKDGCDGKVFFDQTTKVKKGMATPKFKGTPMREGYIFIGWMPKVAETVTEDAIYIAQWEFEELINSKYIKNKTDKKNHSIEDKPLIEVSKNTPVSSKKLPVSSKKLPVSFKHSPVLSKNPITGDSINIMNFAVVFIMAGIIIIVAFMRKKK